MEPTQENHDISLGKKVHPVPTREEFLSKITGQPQAFVSEVWEVTLKYRRASQLLKQKARAIATNSKGELDNEKFECALIMACTLEPKLNEIDVLKLMEMEASEVNKYAALIVGSGNPQT